MAMMIEVPYVHVTCVLVSGQFSVRFKARGREGIKPVGSTGAGESGVAERLAASQQGLQSMGLYEGQERNTSTHSTEVSTVIHACGVT
jgi:hypothetical protein